MKSKRLLLQKMEHIKGKRKQRNRKGKLSESFSQNIIFSPKSPGVVTSVETVDKRTPPPQLHALSTLQATANRLWKTSPANVLKTMQGLYEKKLVTYPRTDSRYITPSEFTYLAGQVTEYQQLIGHTFPVASLAPKKRYVDSSKVQEHYAIIPTKKIPSQGVLAGSRPSSATYMKKLSAQHLLCSIPIICTPKRK